MACTNDFLSSSAHIFGIAQLSGIVSVPDKPRTVILEAGFWNRENPVLGIFQYYNSSPPPINFQPGESYFIHSPVSFSLASSVSSTHYIARLPWHEAVSKSQTPLLDVDDEFDVMGDVFSVSISTMHFYSVPISLTTASRLFPRRAPQRDTCPQL